MPISFDLFSQQTFYDYVCTRKENYPVLAKNMSTFGGIPSLLIYSYKRNLDMIYLAFVSGVEIFTTVTSRYVKRVKAFFSIYEWDVEWEY